MGLFGFGKPSDKEMSEFAARALRLRFRGEPEGVNMSPAVAQEIIQNDVRSLNHIYARLKDWEQTKKEFAQNRGLGWPV